MMHNYSNSFIETMDELQPDYLERVDYLSLQGVRQYYVDCGKHRLETLLDICNSVTSVDQHAVIYCQTFETVLLVADHLKKNGLEVLSLNASKENLSETNNTIRDFRERHRGFLVSTQMPLASEHYELNCYIPLSIHYDTPKTHEDSLARTGKSGRRGRRSTSIMLIKDDNDKKFVISEFRIFNETIEELPDKFVNEL
jgi:ATP-dependent RNA helicase